MATDRAYAQTHPAFVAIVIQLCGLVDDDAATAEPPTARVSHCIGAVTGRIQQAQPHPSVATCIDTYEDA